MTTYTDNFNRADNAATIGAGWTERISGNTLGILSNAAYPTASNAFCGATYDTPMGSNDVTIRMDLSAHVSSTICSPFIYLSYDTSGHGVIVAFSAGGGNTQAIIGTTASAGYDPGATVNTQAVGSFVINLAGDSVGVKLVGNTYTIQHLSGGVMTDTTIVWNDTTPVATRDSSHRLAGCGGQAFLGSYWPIDTFTAVDTAGGATPTNLFFF